jgi:pyrimidine-nucleoside phosphorylase
MKFLELLEAKRDGHTLSAAQLQAIVSDFVAGRIPDYQMAAFLMAVFFRGLQPDETRALTLAMRDSGDQLAFPPDNRPLVDKHSTGGVGDKVSLPLAPLLASLGFRVPMISGRGLGITGGTLDKLDSIPGFKSLLPSPELVELVQSVGCVICGQTERMVPADKGLYALRDVTGTIPSVPLIVASILSKKLAERLDALVLDVKFGAAAFMPTLAEATRLAEAMVALGNDCGVRTRALLTNMDAPIGRAAGNWLEVKEAVQCLTPSATSATDELADLRELVITCAAHLLALTGKSSALDHARHQAEACLASGEPLARWEAMLIGQGADLEAYHRQLAEDPAAAVLVELHAPRSGFVTRCDARLLGEIIRDLGGGRFTRESTIRYEVGIDRLIKPGEPIRAGEVLARLHAPDSNRAQAALAQLEQAFTIADEPPPRRTLIAGTTPASVPVQRM